MTRRATGGVPAESARGHDVVFYTPWIGSILSEREVKPPGGAETQVLLLAQALARRGLRVAIIAFGEGGELPADTGGVRIIPRPPYRKPTGIISRCAEVLRIVRSLRAAPSHTVVYRGGGFEVGVVGLFSRLARRRFVFASASIVDFEYHRLEHRPLQLLLHKLGVRLADAIVVQTEEQVELCESALRRKPVLIKSIAPLAEPQDSAPEAFLWVGRLVPYKRPLEYIALARALPEAQFWMVGVASLTDPQNDSFAESVRRESQNVPNLQLLPPRPHTAVGKLMSRAAASVNTAEFEGMPNVFLEAWSRGVPALALGHDPGGVVEAHDLGGFAAGSFDKLVQLAREQWHQRHERRDLAQRCRAYIQAHHAPEAVAESWQRILQERSSRVRGGARTRRERPCVA